MLSDSVNNSKRFSIRVKQTPIKQELFQNAETHLELF